VLASYEAKVGLRHCVTTSLVAPECGMGSKNARTIPAENILARIIAPVAVLVAALFLGGLWWMTQGSEETGFAQCSATEPGLICFAHAFCPDVCPLEAEAVADACFAENI